MRWDRLFADLSAQLDEEKRLDDESELPELIRADWSRSGLQERVAAHVGATLSFRAASHRVDGAVRHVGNGWCLVVGAGGESTVVSLHRLDAIAGLAPRHRRQSATQALSLGHALRILARNRAEVRLWLVGAHSPMAGRIVAVGADYVDLLPSDGAESAPATIPVAGIVFASTRE